MSSRLVANLEGLRRLGLSAYLRRRGWEDGLLGGRPGWLLLGVMAWGLRAARRAWHKEPELVYRTQLRAGEALVVRTSRPGAANGGS